MITLKITTKNQNEKNKKIGNYYLNFNGHFKEEGNKKKIALKFRNNVIGFLDKEKRKILNNVKLYTTGDLRTWKRNINLLSKKIFGKKLKVKKLRI